MAGVVASVAIVSVTVVGAQMYDVSKAATLPMQYDQCPNHLFNNM